MRKPAPSARPRLEDLSLQDLIARGEALLSARNYKDAIDACKLLLKREPKGHWREALATAYLERAKELAGKAMYREAIVLWENIHGLCGQSPQPELCVDWLLRAGQYTKAMTLYARHATALTGAAELETLIAAIALAGQKEVLQALPPEMPLRRHLATIQAALSAYSQGEAEAIIRAALQKVSIRSPYRDLRQIITALVTLETDPAAAPALVERIAPDSPYHGLTDLIRVCATDQPADTLLTLDHAQRELAAPLLGLDSRQSKLLKDWAKLGESSDPKTRFGFITTHLADFDRESARRACLALLPGYHQGLSTYSRLFGSLPGFESHRLNALRLERDHEFTSALRHWRTCANEVAKEAGNPDARMMAALVLRHMAELAEHGEDSFWDEPLETAGYLEESLKFDPSDRDTYLKLADINQEAGNDKDYHRWVDQAVKQFPDDPVTLMAAVKTTTARKAYKKAAGFATRVLELDPINTQARIVLINAHLAHARKQILIGKYELATKELNSASQLERDNARRGVVEMNRGLLAFRQSQPDLTRQWLQEGARLAGSPLVAWLQLAVEATRLKLEPTTFQRDLQLGDPRKFTASRAELLALTQRLNAYREEGVVTVSAALEDLEKPLKRAIKALSDQDDLLSICECLHQVPHYELLEYAATHAIDLLFKQPLFVYYQICGRAEGMGIKVKGRDEQRLESAMEAAEDAKDHRTAIRINRFLNGVVLPASSGRPKGNRRSASSPINLRRSMPAELLEEIEEMRQQLNEVPPALRKIMLEQMLDDLPDDDEFPPEIQRAIMRMLLLGKSGADDRDDDGPNFPFPFPLPRGRGGRRRS